MLPDAAVPNGLLPRYNARTAYSLISLTPK